MKPTSLKQAQTVWLITSLFSLFQFFLQVASNMMTTQYMQSFHINEAGVGALSSAFFYSYVLVQIPAGLLFDQFHLKKVLLKAAGVCALGCALFSFSPNFYCAFLSRLLMGAGGGFAFVGMVFACAESFSPKTFTLALGLGELVGMLGTSIGQRIVPYFVLDYGWREVMLSCAFLGAGLVLFMYFALDKQVAPTASNEKLFSKILNNTKQAMLIPTVWLAGVFCFGMFAVVTTFASLWGVPFLQAVHHVTYITATGSIALILMGIAFGGPIAGWLFGKMSSPKLLMLGFGLGAFCCTLLVLYRPDLSNQLLDISLFGMGLFCSIYVTAFSVVERATPHSIRGTALGLCNAIALLGAIVFQPMIGWLLTHTQQYSTSDIATNYQVSLSILPAMMLLALLSVMLMRLKQSVSPSLNELIFKHNLAQLGQNDAQYNETSSENNISTNMVMVESPSK